MHTNTLLFAINFYTLKFYPLFICTETKRYFYPLSLVNQIYTKTLTFIPYLFAPKQRENLSSFLTQKPERFLSLIYYFKNHMHVFWVLSIY